MLSAQTRLPSSSCKHTCIGKNKSFLERGYIHVGFVCYLIEFFNKKMFKLILSLQSFNMYRIDIYYFKWIKPTSLFLHTCIFIIPPPHTHTHMYTHIYVDNYVYITIITIEHSYGYYISVSRHTLYFVGPCVCWTI